MDSGICSKCNKNNTLCGFKMSVAYYHNIIDKVLPDFYNIGQANDNDDFLKKIGISQNWFCAQIIFEFWYDYYIANAEYKSLYTALDAKGDADRYKKFKRWYDSIQHNKGEVKKKLGYSTQSTVSPPYDNGDKKLVTDHMKEQLEFLESEITIKKIFFKLANGLGTSKNYTEFEFEKDLALFEEVYAKIKNSEASYFIKCVQYYQLEINYRYETYYKLFKTMKKLKRSGDTKRNDIIEFRKFYCGVMKVEDFTNVVGYDVKSEDGLVKMQNRFIANIESYIEKYSSSPDDISRITLNIFLINTIRRIILEEMKNLPFEIDFNIEECLMAEGCFRTFLGEGQHIVKNKDFCSDINTRDFRKIYSK